eukprot:486397-Hanusia_phi.AAC.4
MGMNTDMEAQRFCEAFYQLVIVSFSAVGFVVGYWFESFRITMYAVFAGVAISCALCVPDWGLFRGKESQRRVE